jgi:hypothetical protein
MLSLKKWKKEGTLWCALLININEFRSDTIFP